MPPIEWLIVVLAMVGMAVGAFIWEKIRQKQNDAQPQVSVQARILRINKRRSGKIVWAAGQGHINLNRRYYITFALLPEGSKKRFAVPVSGYEWLSKEDFGTLTLQGTRFVHFKRVVRANTPNH